MSLPTHQTQFKDKCEHCNSGHLFPYVDDWVCEDCFTPILKTICGVYDRALQDIMLRHNALNVEHVEPVKLDAFHSQVAMYNIQALARAWRICHRAHAYCEYVQKAQDAGEVSSCQPMSENMSDGMWKRFLTQYQVPVAPIDTVNNPTRIDLWAIDLNQYHCF